MEKIVSNGGDLPYARTVNIVKQNRKNVRKPVEIQ